MQFIGRILLLALTLLTLIVIFSTLGVLFLGVAILLVPLFFWYRWKSPNSPQENHRDPKGNVIIEGDYDVVEEEDDTTS